MGRFQSTRATASCDPVPAIQDPLAWIHARKPPAPRRRPRPRGSPRPASDIRQALVLRTRAAISAWPLLGLLTRGSVLGPEPRSAQALPKADPPWGGSPGWVARTPAPARVEGGSRDEITATTLPEGRPSGGGAGAPGRQERRGEPPGEGGGGSAHAW